MKKVKMIYDWFLANFSDPRFFFSLLALLAGAVIGLVLCGSYYLFPEFAAKFLWKRELMMPIAASFIDTAIVILLTRQAQDQEKKAYIFRLSFYCAVGLISPLFFWADLKMASLLYFLALLIPVWAVSCSLAFALAKLFSKTPAKKQ